MIGQNIGGQGMMEQRMTGRKPVSEADRFNTSHPDLCSSLRWKGQFVLAEHDPTVQRAHTKTHTVQNIYFDVNPSYSANRFLFLALVCIRSICVVAGGWICSPVAH